MTYDSTLDTLRHSRRVDELLQQLISEMQGRLHCHDESKLHPPEKPIFDLYTPKLATVEYGTHEYRSLLGEMKLALDHHYAHNPHHPEHHGGIGGMTIIDLGEMLSDWAAACERTLDGRLGDSLLINTRRFEIGPQLASILSHTAAHMGWT